MASSQNNVPTTQSALQWVRVSDTNPFEWNRSAPVVQSSQLGDNNVLIQNYAVALNPVDYKITAYNFTNTKLPAVTGCDFSGRVVAVGKAVKDLQVGDEVFGVLSLDSSNGGGAFQQYTVGEAKNLRKKASQRQSHRCSNNWSGFPRSYDMTDVFWPINHSLPFFLLQDAFRQVKIGPSTTVFIPGGSGGVGHFAVQIAQIHGAKQVITSASKDEGIEILRDQYKVKEVINHSKEDVVKRVLELTDGQGADFVYDATYLESSLAKSTQTVKQGGSWAVLGDFGKEDSAAAKALAIRKATLVKADLGRYLVGPQQAQYEKFLQDGLAQAAKWIEEGKLKPYVNQVIKLEDVQTALEQMKQGKTASAKLLLNYCRAEKVFL